MFYFGICVTFTILAFNLKIANTFLYLQNHSLVRDCRNYFRPREHPRRRTHSHQLPYYTRDYGWRLHIWSERTVSHLVWSRGELFICRKRVAFRRGTESSDKSLPVPTDYRGGVLQTPKSLHSKGVLNILNLKEDYCFLWCILAHIHRVKKHADELYNYNTLGWLFYTGVAYRAVSVAIQMWTQVSSTHSTFSLVVTPAAESVVV